jgi:hypothetical protein
MNLEKYPMLIAAFTKMKNGCSDEELAEWIRSLSREENARLDEELVQVIFEECRERRKIGKHREARARRESLGIRSYALPIFLAELLEKCKFWENQSKREHDEKRNARSCAND